MFRRKEEIYEINISGIPFEISRKRIKNLYVRVHRTTGKVRVSCPIRISDFHLEQFIHSKIDWVRKQRVKSVKKKPIQELQYINGELILFGGEEYKLEVNEGVNKSNARLIGDSLIINIRGESTLMKRKKLLENWYRDQLEILIPNLIKKYDSKMGVKVNEFRIKRMKTRWGTCNIRVGRIWLSLELAKKPWGCLEMVVVHEMVHLLERLHNKRFYNLMDDFMPNWREFNKELNSSID
tara:strand:+ start:3498 stop:4211 length:714 start_codon:yes stop_codon:yes gene_type:complete